MVKHLPFYPKAEGSSPAIAAGRRKEKITKNSIFQQIFDSQTIAAECTAQESIF